MINPKAAPKSSLFFSTPQETRDLINSKAFQSSNDVVNLRETKREIRSDDGRVVNNTIDLPRSTNQFKNSRFNKLKKLRLFNDQILNLNALSMTSMHDFIKFIGIAPDLQVYLATDSAIKLANMLFKLDVKQQIYFDPTYGFRNVYVTTVAIKVIHFIEEPVVPIAFFIHKRRYYTRYFQFLVCFLFQQLDLNPNIGFTSDREKGIIDAVQDALKLYDLEDNQFYCMKHVFDDIKRYACNQKVILKKKKKCEKEDEQSKDEQSEDDLKDEVIKETKDETTRLKIKDANGFEDDPDWSEPPSTNSEDEDEISAEQKDEKFSLKESLQKLSNFKNDAYDILKAGSLNEFNDLERKLSSNWLNKSKQYFEKCIKPALEINYKNDHKLDFIDATGTPTTNPVEGIHSSVKHSVHNKQIQVDMLTIELYKYQTEFIDKLNQSYNGVGQYTLKKEYSSKFGFQLECNEQFDFVSELEQLNGQFKIVKKELEPGVCYSQAYLAECIIKHKLIDYSCNLDCFIVKEPVTGKRHFVDLIDGKAVCNCNLENCCHQLAVELQSKNEAYSIINERATLLNINCEASGNKGKDEIEKQKRNRPRMQHLNKASKTKPKISETKTRTTRTQLRSSRNEKKEDDKLIDLTNLEDERALEIDLNDDYINVLTIMEKEFTCCSKLTDEIINFYLMKLMVKKNARNVLFIPPLHFESNRSLFKYIHSNYTSEIEYIVAVIHLPDHWVAGILVNDSNDIYILDSSLSADHNILKYQNQFEKFILISDIFQKIELSCLPKLELLDVVYQKYNCYVVTDVQQQIDNFNCGVFACFYIDSLLSNTKTPIDCNEYRNKIKNLIFDTQIDLEDLSSARTKMPKKLETLYRSPNYYNTFKCLNLNIKTCGYARINIKCYEAKPETDMYSKILDD